MDLYFYLPKDSVDPTDGISNNQWQMDIHLWWILLTVKSFSFVGTKFRGLMMMDMFVDTWFGEFSNSTQNY